jgi:hypothetical protein
MTEHRRANMSEDPARSPTLPGWAYTDPALFEREKREIPWLWRGPVLFRSAARRDQ